jgi:hypothetical protein
VFLGIDEKINDGGFHYKNFTGAPHFALDITPKKTFEKEAIDLTESLVGSGLKFSEGMRAMSFPADVGKKISPGSNTAVVVFFHSLSKYTPLTNTSLNL